MSLSAIAAAKRLGIAVIGSYHKLLPEYARCWSEPIHIYDDRHGFLFAFKELIYSYARAYSIARLNKKRLQLKASLKDLLAAYRAYLQEKEQIIRVVG